MRRRLEITENVVEKEVRISEGSIPSLLWRSYFRVAIVENDDLVDAKYGTCTRNLSSQCSFLVVGESAS